MVGERSDFAGYLLLLGEPRFFRLRFLGPECCLDLVAALSCSCSGMEAGREEAGREAAGGTIKTASERCLDFVAALSCSCSGMEAWREAGGTKGAASERMLIGDHPRRG